MTRFQEFLHRKAEEQDQPSRRQRREEWISAVDRLISQIDAWLRESDPEGVLDLIDLDFDKAEAALGRYKVHGLKVALGDLSAQVVPVAGRVVGSSRLQDGATPLAGRVDITNGTNKYVVMRVVKDGAESWEVWNDKFGAVPLDHAQLESILEDLLT